MPSSSTKILRASYVHHGRREYVHVEVPDSGEPAEQLLQETNHFLQSLEDNQQIEHEDEPAVHAATHRIESQADGTRRLVRKRFSAI